jgi:hypothetical protein
MATELTRRRLVKAGVGIAAVGVTGTAGCSMPGSLLGGASYTKWLHEPGAFGEDDHYSTLVVDTSSLYDNEDELPGGMVDNFESYIERTTELVGLDADEVDRYLETNRQTVLLGSFNADDLGDELEDQDFDDASDHEGFTIYEHESDYTSRAVGVSGDAVVVLSGEDPADDVETVVDVANGSEDRYVEENEDLQVLTDKLGTGLYVTAETQPERDETYAEGGVFEHQVATGTAVKVEGDTSRAKWVRVFDDENDVDLDEVEEWTEAASDTDETFDEVDDVDVSKSGRAAVVTGTIETDELFNY